MTNMDETQNCTKTSQQWIGPLLQRCTPLSGDTPDLLTREKGSTGTTCGGTTIQDMHVTTWSYSHHAVDEGVLHIL